MAAEALVRELEEKRKKEISKLESDYLAKKEEINRLAQAEHSKISDSARAQAVQLSQREKIRIEGAGKLQSKRIIFDSTEKMIETNLSALKTAFAKYAHSKEYDELLINMAKYASKRLGGEIRVICKEIDVTILKKAGISVAKSDLNSIGGLKAESKDQSLELDMTFEELLRSHEDEIRGLIQSKKDEG